MTRRANNWTALNQESSIRWKNKNNSNLEPVELLLASTYQLYLRIVCLLQRRQIKNRQHFPRNIYYNQNELWQRDSVTSVSKLWKSSRSRIIFMSSWSSYSHSKSKFWWRVKFITIRKNEQKPLNQKPWISTTESTGQQQKQQPP